MNRQVEGLDVEDERDVQRNVCRLQLSAVAGRGSEIAYYDFQLAVYVFKLYSFISGAIESDRSTGKRQCTFFFFLFVFAVFAACNLYQYSMNTIVYRIGYSPWLLNSTTSAWTTLPQLCYLYADL